MKKRSAAKRSTQQEPRKRPERAPEPQDDSAVTLAAAKASLHAAGIADDWDLLLVGDGSGSTWQRGMGWGCISVDKRSGERQEWVGAANRGTVNMAELLAYLAPLSYYAAEHARIAKRGELYTVVIVTDSQVTATNGERIVRGSAPDLTTTQGLLWRLVREFREYGMVLRWHHLNRQTLDMNSQADGLSKWARKTLEHSIQRQLRNPEEQT